MGRTACAETSVTNDALAEDLKLQHLLGMQSLARLSVIHILPLTVQSGLNRRQNEG